MQTSIYPSVTKQRVFENQLDKWKTPGKSLIYEQLYNVLLLPEAKKPVLQFLRENPELIPLLHKAIQLVRKLFGNIILEMDLLQDPEDPNQSPFLTLRAKGAFSPEDAVEKTLLLSEAGYRKIRQQSNYRISVVIRPGRSHV